MSMRQLKITKSITNRESQSLEKYLQEISKVELISCEEEVLLARRIKKGEQSALDKLVKGNLRFVVSVAKQYQNQGLSLPDLINEGNLGLIKAALRFDETKGFKFISYAVWWIRQCLLQALAEQSRIVRLPLNKIGLTNRINKMYQQLEQVLEREPTLQELSESIEIDIQEISSLLSLNRRHLSMDSPLIDDGENTLADVIENTATEKTDSKLEHHESLQKEIQRSLCILTKRQKEILCYYFGIGLDHASSIEDIAEFYDVTRERVRQIKDKALLKLKSTSRCKQLKVYLGK